MAIQKGNSQCIIGTIPTTKGLDEIYEFVDHELDKPDEVNS